eukprot:15361709-Ditylum_brightwellii.AAC.1
MGLDMQQIYTTMTTPALPQITIFDSYLAMLQEWDYILLQDIEFYKPTHHIAQLSSHPTTTILIASDGSSSEEDD